MIKLGTDLNRIRTSLEVGGVKFSKSVVYAVVVGLFFAQNVDVFAQKTVTTQYQNWTQYFLSVRLKEHWSINTDVLYRWKDLDGQKLQTGIRGSLTYHFKQPITVACGYVYFVHFPLDKDVTVTKREHRPWQQLIITNKMGRTQVQHRYRLEQRFIEKATSTALTGGYSFNFRMRYQLNLQCPINKKEITKGTLYAIAYNELFINFGKEIVYNYFDQNRIGLGLGYQLTKSFAATVSYQYIWQQTSKGNAYREANCLRLSFVHTLDLRKKEEY